MDHHQQASGYNWPAMWTTTVSSTSKRKHEYSPSYDSWEEKAFAEDAAGLLGSSGCVWPPRSYTCTFCRREFRSAQTLGGHMNVHRRDRARLNQLPPNTPQHDHQQAPLNPNYPIHDGCGNSHHLLKPTFLMSSNHPNHKICPNPNSHGILFYPSSLSLSSSLPIFQQEKSSTFAIGRPMSTREMQISSNAIPPPLITWSSKPSSASNFHQRSRHDEKKEANIISVECQEENEGDINFVNSELSISLSLVVQRNLPVEEAKAQAGGFKRRKVDTLSPEPSPLLILISSEASSTVIDKKRKIDHSPREVHGLTNPYSLKEIDLELRLGG